MVHQNLLAYMERERVKDKELAARIGVSRSYVTLLKSRKRRPSPQLAERISEVTGIPFRNLLLGQD